MRRFALALCLAQSLALTPVASLADPILDIDWQLLAIDGTPVDPSVTASLRIEASGQVTGKAPCNSYGARNTGSLPLFSLGPIRMTRMACDNMDAERAYTDALASMTTLALDGDRNLILTSPDGRSIEFVLDRADSQTLCKTCLPKE